MENHAVKVLSDTNNSIYKYMLFFTKTPWEKMRTSASRVFSVSVSLYMLAMLMTLANTPAAVTEAPAP